MTDPLRRDLAFAEDLTAEDVRRLEAFLHEQLDRVREVVGETGETAFAIRALIRLISDSAGLLDTLLRTEHPDASQKATIVREWHRLRSTAQDFNHRDGYDHDRWWTPIWHFDAAAWRVEQARIRATDPGPYPEESSRGAVRPDQPDS